MTTLTSALQVHVVTRCSDYFVILFDEFVNFADLTAKIGVKACQTFSETENRRAD